jgi:hypothetical protein
VRFSNVIEKKLRMYALEHGITLSDAIRQLILKGMAQTSEPAPVVPPASRRRVLSRGVT